MSDSGTTTGGLIAKSATLFGVCLIVLGVLALAMPQQAGIAIALGIGVLLLLSGVLKVVFLWLSPSWGTLLLRLLFGLVAVLAGAYMIANPRLGLQAITIVAIVYFIFDGIIEILLGIRFPPGRGGIWLVVSGVISLGLGILIWRQWPVSGDVAIAILVGIKLILNGIVIVAVSRSLKAFGGMLQDH